MTATIVASHPLETGCPPAWASEWGEDCYGVFVAFQVGNVTQRLRWIPSGTFWMGSPESEKGRWDDEGPRHLVMLTKGFWLADTPCTQELWQEVMGANPSHFQGPLRPVENVSWYDCQEFMTALNRRVPNLGVGFPAEAQWEYACRAGIGAGTWVGNLKIDGGGIAPLLDGIAWYYGAHSVGPHKVAAKIPNPWGLYDMLGNVYEWCADWQSTYSASTAIDPTGPLEGTKRVRRGGSWGSLARFVRAASRDWLPPRSRRSVLGFRLSRGQEERIAERAEPSSRLSAEPEEARRGARRRLR